MLFGFDQRQARRIRKATELTEAHGLPAAELPADRPSCFTAYEMLGEISEPDGIASGASGEAKVFANDPEADTGETRTVWNWAESALSEGQRVMITPANGRLYAVPLADASLVAGQVWTSSSPIVIPSGVNEWVTVTGYQYEIDSGLDADAAAGTITLTKAGVYYIWAHVLADLGGTGRSGLMRFAYDGVGGTLVMGNDNSNQSSFIHAGLSGIWVELTEDIPSAITLELAKDAGGSITVEDVVFGAFAITTGEGAGGGGPGGDSLPYQTVHGSWAGTTAALAKISLDSHEAGPANPEGLTLDLANNRWTLSNGYDVEIMAQAQAVPAGAPEDANRAHEISFQLRDEVGGPLLGSQAIVLYQQGQLKNYGGPIHLHGRAAAGAGDLALYVAANELAGFADESFSGNCQITIRAVPQ